MTTSPHQPRISVLVNNYNYGSYIAEALDSAITQLQDGDELIVVDDGSTDNSLDILRNFEVRHGIILISQENQGQMNAVRAAVASAQGDVIVLLDSDDLLIPNYLNRLRKLYSEDPALSFVFSAPEVFGPDINRIEGIRRAMQKMAFPKGRIGPTKWATILFNEFVSTPTSGISMLRKLADKIMSVPPYTEDKIIISPFIRRLFGISKSEVQLRHISADAIMVRCASVLDIVKYYDDRPGFGYRVHGNNKWASIPKVSRWYLRRARANYIRQIYQNVFGINLRPETMELHHEICNRSWSLYLPRQIKKRGEYFVATITSRGKLKTKLKTAAAALGF